MNREDADEFAREWVEAWNNRDLELILASVDRHTPSWCCRTGGAGQLRLPRCVNAANIPVVVVQDVGEFESVTCHVVAKRVDLISTEFKE